MAIKHSKGTWDLHNFNAKLGHFRPFACGSMGWNKIVSNNLLEHPKWSRNNFEKNHSGPLFDLQSKQKLPKANITQNNYQKMKVVVLIGPLFRCRPLFVASIARGVVSCTLPVQKHLSCAKYDCDGCWLDHSTAICPAL